MSSDPAMSERLELPPKQAQEALAEALDADIEEADVIKPDPEQDGETIIRLEQDMDEDEGSLDDPFAGMDNPFAAAAEFSEHVRMAEALLFAAIEPLDEASLAARLPEGAMIAEILETLKQQYENRGVNLMKNGRKWQFVTAPAVAPILEKEQIQPRKLSKAAMETLAIIAYHQPCTRAEIEEIRGVAVSKGSLDLLMEINWIKLRGRKKDTPGRPLLYGTSQEFLEHFGLESISHLPGMADLKAAGLLEARLPPGFSIPTPQDGDEIEDQEEGIPESEFVDDFLAETDRDDEGESEECDSNEEEC
ncbi:MAG: SMC-Scp complex subunit ScpB [bacterium]